MYDYIAVRIDAETCGEDITDLLAAFLADVEFETFEPDEYGLTAYVRKDKYQRESVKKILEDFPIPTKLKMHENEIKGEDWNKEWEQNYFKPIKIGNKLVVRSSFHESFPDVPFEIIIDPKMAFGTGHHSTTAGMSRMLMEEDLNGKSVIDMGTGTGILAILSKMLGSAQTTGIDIDEFAIENAKENGVLNKVDIYWKIGDDRTLQELESADFFLANINLNVITAHLDKYIEKLNPGGRIFLSGFLKSDRQSILKETERYNLTLYKEAEEKGWMTMGFIK